MLCFIYAENILKKHAGVMCGIPLLCKPEEKLFYYNEEKLNYYNY